MIGNLRALFWMFCFAPLWLLSGLFGLLADIFTDSSEWCSRRIR